MTTAPAGDQRALLDVQALDTTAAQLAHRRATLPVLGILQELQGRIADVQGALTASRTAAADLRRELAKAEADVEQVRTRSARNQERIDSGQGSAKDLQALMSEQESLARRQSDLEDVELEVMERLEAHESALAQLEEAERQLLEHRTQAEQERDEAVAQIAAEEADVARRRAAVAAGLDAGLVALYEKVRERTGMGAAALRGGRCEACRLDLNATELAAVRAADPDAVVRHEECGRILVRVADAA